MANMVPGAVGRYLMERLGGPVEARTTVTTAALLQNVVLNNFERVGLLIINLGANDMYLSPVRAPGVDRGILVRASGGLVSFGVRDDFVMPALQWYANNAVFAAGDVLVIEMIRVRVADQPDA